MAVDELTATLNRENIRLREGIRHVLDVMYPTFPIDYNVRTHLRQLLDNRSDQPGDERG